MVDEPSKLQLNAEVNSLGVDTADCESNSQGSASSSVCASAQPTPPQEGACDSKGEGQDAATDQSSDAVPLATGKKPRKEPAARTVTPERREELTFMIHEIVDSLPERGTFDALSFSKKQNLALDLVKDIYMEASDDFDKLVKYNGKPESKGLVISQKSNLMLKIENFKKLNKGRADAKQFKIGDQFEIKADGDSIILTRVSSASHAA